MVQEIEMTADEQLDMYNIRLTHHSKKTTFSLKSKIIFENNEKLTLKNEGEVIIKRRNFIINNEYNNIKEIKYDYYPV